MLSLDSQYNQLNIYAETHTRKIDVSLRQVGKRTFDICFSSLVVLFVLSWMIPLVGLLIKLESRGPVLFVQKRTGYLGNWFYCFKFRTMLNKRESSFRQTAKNDGRVTPLGGFLRRTNLDEMPQFLNVLMGNMSVVGPRPHALQHSAQYWNTMPEYRRRYRVKPGITGLAQIRGCRGETDQLLKMKHRVRYDRFYNRKKTASMDIWICWLTVKAMINGNINAW
jgi:putative colanic acid biosynthesis UDP-glucose lipid carrier transferase